MFKIKLTEAFGYQFSNARLIHIEEISSWLFDRQIIAMKKAIKHKKQ